MISRAAWALLLLLTPLPSAAQTGLVDDETPSARLEYELGPGAQACPSVDIMRGAVAARLGFSPFSQVATRTLRVRLFAPPRRRSFGPGDDFARGRSVSPRRR